MENIFKDLHLLIRIAQCFGVFPATGVSSRNYLEIQFSWSSKRFLYTLVLCFLYLLLFISYFWIEEEKLGLAQFVGMLPAGIVFAMLISYIDIARNWPDLIYSWNKVDKVLCKYKDYHPPNTTMRKLAVVELCLFAGRFLTVQVACLHFFLPICPAAETYWERMKLYAFMAKKHIFKTISYSKSTVISFIFVDYILEELITLTATWVYEFLALVLASYFRSINRSMREFQFKKTPADFWKSRREDHNKVTVLMKNISDTFSAFLFFQLAMRAMFCLEIYFSFWHSFGYTASLLLIVIAITMAQVAITLFVLSTVHEEVKAGLAALYSVPSECYNVEVERFVEQIANEEQAISIRDYVFIKRSILILVGGLSITLSLLMYQLQKSDYRKPSQNQYFNSSCIFDLEANSLTW